ncbi:MAG TPA: [acyl-carrier-protein] S-malonyltransferase [Gammaproteobacteria bacterium]|nr:[acyl-carrier-protein] S-malonyltransferase [Gammaproteobacteria bacterium]
MKAYIFPGQGSQYKGMGADLFEKYADMVQTADDILGYSIVELCLKDPDRQLGFTQYTQPALYVVSAMSYLDKIEKTGHLPEFLAGHSLGEYNALQASGAISFEDGLKLVKRRGELMSLAPKGAMAAILGSTKKKISQLLKNNDLSTVDIANHNSYDQTVISGLEEDINRAQSIFTEDGIKFIPLNTSGAFHSRYMKSSAVEFKKYVRRFEFSPLTIDVISNVHAKPYRQEKIIENLTSQIIRPVKWLDSVSYMLEQGVTEFEETGAGHVLTALVEKIQTQFGQSNTEIVPDASAAKDPEAKAIQGDVTSHSESGVKNTAETIAAWNAAYPVGTRVSVKNHDDVLETRTQAIALFGRKATIYMQGYKGYFDLGDVQPVNE